MKDKTGQHMKGPSWTYPPRQPVSDIVEKFLDRLPDALRGQATPWRVLAGRLLFSDSRRVGRVFHVLQGAISLRRHFLGEETVIQWATGGDWLVEPDPFSSDAGAWAMCEADSLLIGLPAKAFCHSLDTESAFALAWRRDLLRQLMQMKRHRLRLSHTTAEQRVIHFLMTESPGGRGEMALPYSKATWAGQLGVTPETLSRALTRMETEGMLERISGKGYRVLRPPVSPFALRGRRSRTSPPGISGCNPGREGR